MTLGTNCCCVDEPEQVVGACCFDDGSCQRIWSIDEEGVRRACEDTLGGEFQGLDVECIPNPCPQEPPPEDKCVACCYPDGHCEDRCGDSLVVANARCVASGGDPQGEGSECATTNCPQPPAGPCLFCITEDIPSPLGINIAGVTVNGGAGVNWVRAADAATWLNALTTVPRSAPVACGYQTSTSWEDTHPVFGWTITTTVQVGMAYDDLGANIRPFMNIIYSEDIPAANSRCSFVYRADFPEVAQPTDCTAGRGPTAFTLRANNPAQPGGFLCPGITSADVPLLMGTGEIT